MEIGSSYKAEVLVDENLTARHMGSGDLDVFATPAMIALMEKAAALAVKSKLEEGTGTVGTLLNVKHLAATPVGMKVYAEAELIEIDGKRLVFTVKAFDEVGLIGEGTHERFIILNSKFMERTNNKLTDKN